MGSYSEPLQVTLTYYTIQARKENYKFSSLQNFKVSLNFVRLPWLDAYFGMKFCLWRHIGFLRKIVFKLFNNVSYGYFFFYTVDS
jgi:hypothetical protein